MLAVVVTGSVCRFPHALNRTKAYRPKLKRAFSALEFTGNSPVPFSKYASTA